MKDGTPIIGGEDEAQRLHEIAKTAAIQTGVKGLALDQLIAEIFSSMVARSNKIEAHRLRREQLHAVN